MCVGCRVDVCARRNLFDYDSNSGGFRNIIVKNFTYSTLPRTAKSVFAMNETTVCTANTKYGTGVKLDFTKDFVIETKVKVGAAGTRDLIAGCYKSSTSDVFLNIEINASNQWRVQYTTKTSNGNFLSDKDDPNNVVENGEYEVKFMWFGQAKHFALYINGKVVTGGTNDYLQTLYATEATNELCYGGKDHRSQNSFPANITVYGFNYYVYD